MKYPISDRLEDAVFVVAVHCLEAMPLSDSQHVSALYGLAHGMSRTRRALSWLCTFRDPPADSQF